MKHDIAFLIPFPYYFSPRNRTISGQFQSLMSALYWHTIWWMKHEGRYLPWQYAITIWPYAQCQKIRLTHCDCRTEQREELFVILFRPFSHSKNVFHTLKALNEQISKMTDTDNIEAPESSSSTPATARNFKNCGLYDSKSVHFLRQT